MCSEAARARVLSSAPRCLSVLSSTLEQHHSRSLNELGIAYQLEGDDLLLPHCESEYAARLPARSPHESRCSVDYCQLRTTRAACKSLCQTRRAPYLSGCACSFGCRVSSKYDVRVE